MIERGIVNGRPATIAYIDGEWEPTTRERAASIKVIFDDSSEVVFLSPRTAVLRDKSWDESKHPRGQPGNAGQFGPGGGGVSATTKIKVAARGKAEHPGKGYSKEARLINGVIHTTEVEDAALALHQHRRVELDQPRGVSMVLDKLANVAEDMIKKGEKAPNINLCNLSVRGTNLFCVDHKGIPRIKMPQMDEEQTEKFKVYLKDKGYKILDEEQFASHMRATQNELNGGKVAGIARALRKQAYEAPRMVVSDDDYILDGHHRWAAKIGNDSRDGVLTNDAKIKISRVKISITKLLTEAYKFTGGKGAKGIGDRGYIDLADAGTWEESKHPRGQPENAGQFGPGGGGAKGEAGDPAAAALLEARTGKKPARVLNPAVTEVGGDDWNKHTAIRLENEYQDAKPKLETILAAYAASEETADPDEDQPEEYAGPMGWSDLAEFTQAKIQEEYFEQKEAMYLEQEIDSWKAGGGGLDQAKSELASSFTFVEDELETWIKGKNDDDEPWTDTKFPFSVSTLSDALKMEYDSDGEGTGKVKVMIYEDRLQDPLSGGEDEDQLRFEGIEKPDYSKLLTRDMRIELQTMLMARFNEQAAENITDLEPPDHLEEAAKEYMETNWQEMFDDDKFAFAKHETSIINEMMEEAEQTGQTSGVIGLPDKYDPLNETSGTDYRKTQKVARALSIARAEEVIKERGIKFGHGAVPKKALSRIDHELWDDWKGSSTSNSGQLLQLAIADELGGRLNPKTGRGGKVELNPDVLKRGADATYGSIGGYEGVKAYVRAKWETTQLLLDKAGKHELHLYRGIGLDSEKFAQASMESHEVEGHRKAPTLRVVRNGAASTTVNPAVANDWSSDDTRVVLRAVVPRTAAVSVPAYGINVKSEQEVVVAGTAWKGWDAWLKKAPKLDRVKMAA